MPTLGETFRTAREQKRLKLIQVAERTRIPVDRLQALESDRWSDLPDDVYLRGAIRNYALFLGLDPGDMEAQYRALCPAEEKRVPLSAVQTRRTVAVIPSIIAVLIVVVLVLILLVALHVIVIP